MNKNGKFANGAILGAIAGAVLGLLYAPTTGAEARKKIKEKAEKIKQNPEIKKALKKVEIIKTKVAANKIAISQTKKKAK